MIPKNEITETQTSFINAKREQCDHVNIKPKNYIMKEQSSHDKMI